MTIAEFINKVGFKVNDGDVKKVNDTIKDIKSTATKLLGAIGIGFSLANMNALVEEFDAINDKINYAVSGLVDAKEAQKDILAAANAVKTSYSDMANVVTNLVKANSDMFPVDEAINFSTNLTKLMKSAGRNDSEIASIMEGMNKSFQKGVVGTETLNKMLEQAPETANYLAEKLGVAKTQLLQMATDGKISVEDLKDAFVESSIEINAAFSQLNFSVSDALLNIRNKWGFWLKETDEMLSLTNTIGKFMVKGFDMALSAINRLRNGVLWLGDKLGGIDKLLNLVAITAGILFAAFNFDKITGGLSSIFKLLIKIRLSMLAIVAVAALIALIGEDFINFMQGGNSLIGNILAKTGVDCDALRERIRNAWDTIRNVFETAASAIKGTVGSLFSIIRQFWEQNGESITQGISSAVTSTVGKLEQFSKWLSENWGMVVKMAGAVLKLVGVFLVTKGVTERVVNTVKKASDAIGSAKKVLGPAAEAFTKAGGGVKGLGAAFKALVSPVGIAIVAIAAIAAVLYDLFNFMNGKDSVFGAVLGKLGVDAEAVREKMIAAWGQIKTFLLSAWNIIKTVATTVFGGLQAFWNTWGGTIMTCFDGVWNIIKGVFNAALDVLVDLFAIFAALFVGDWAGLWEGVKQLGSDVWNGILNIISTILTAIWNVLSSIWSTIWSFLSEILTNIWDGITSTFTNIWNSIVQTVGNIKNSIIEGFQAAIDWIKSLPAQALQWGADIIQAIVDGITGMVGKVGDAAKGIADKIASFLHFSLPDEGPLSDFDRSMPDMMQLMAEGIRKGKSVVSNAIKDLTGDMSGNIRVAAEDLMQFAKAGTPSPMTTNTLVSTSNSRSISLSNVFNQTFNGEKAVQQKAKKAMEQASGDITGELARALAYAR